MSPGIIRALNYTRLTEPTTATLPEEPEEPLIQLLKRALSTRSVISTTSSFASRMQGAAVGSKPGREDLRIIGLGSCGTVFEIPGTELAFKKGTSVLGIWSDFRLTNKVHNAVNHIRTIMQEAFPHSTIPMTPMCHDHYPADHEKFWSENIQRFPASHRTRQPTFTVDRILPLPQVTREGLIKMYFQQNEEVQKKAKNDPENKDCLARIYLGERETVSQQFDAYETLRNFPLRLNMMEYLEVEASELANEMAIGLAILHWQAQVDGMDVEFVLGSSATWDNERPKGYDDMSAPPHTVEAINFNRRITHLWMLDFDKATNIELTKYDVNTKLVPAFLGNDPYYPRPQVDKNLWEDFCGAYLKASGVILSGKRVDQLVRDLPQHFLDEVMRVSREHEDWNEEDNIVFADQSA
ncbi:hypothetical protein OEA41_005534 [Lepraria neglecta]|uniref:DUF3669 domain-containing protein n=1 Tax=Lepraria neglecta TaxID=209136 RepID=A0AAD9Z183_9LECA|nr:hypothetical protein OEA41_005534 [Lepraria neglecta]